MRHLIIFRSGCLSLQLLAPSDLCARGGRGLGAGTEEKLTGVHSRSGFHRPGRVPREETGWHQEREKPRNIKTDPFFKGRSTQVGDGRSTTERPHMRKRRHAELKEQRRQHTLAVRQEWHDGGIRWRNYWRRQQHAHHFYSFRDQDWWTPATHEALAGWISAPALEVTASNASIVLEDGSVFVEGEPVKTLEEQAAEATALAQSIRTAKFARLELLPLGVWAISHDQATKNSSTMFLQLSISKEGIIPGMYQNSLLGTVDSLEGRADPETQTAAWMMVGKGSPVMEAKLGDLAGSDGEAVVLVHFADGVTQQWTLVRLDKLASQ